MYTCFRISRHSWQRSTRYTIYHLKTFSGIYGKNQLLWDLGLNATQMSNLAAIQAKLNELDEVMDLVMIAEHMEESVIMLQDLMCWDIKDVTYLELNKRTPAAKTVMTKETKALLRQWMWADYML